MIETLENYYLSVMKQMVIFRVSLREKIHQLCIHVREIFWNVGKISNSTDMVLIDTFLFY